MSLQGGRGGERAPKGLIGPRRERSGKGRRMLTPSTCSSFDSFRFWTGVNCCSDYAKGSSNFVWGFLGAGEIKVPASHIPSFLFSPPTLSRGQNYEALLSPPLFLTCVLFADNKRTATKQRQDKNFPVSTVVCKKGLKFLLAFFFDILYLSTLSVLFASNIRDSKYSDPSCVTYFVPFSLVVPSYFFSAECAFVLRRLLGHRKRSVPPPYTWLGRAR